MKRRRQSSLGRGHQAGSLKSVPGFWVLRYREAADSSGHRVQRSIRISRELFPTRDLANAECDRLMKLLAPPRMSHVETVPWPQWCDRFLRDYTVELAPGSVAQYRSMIRSTIAEAFGKLAVHEITVPLVQQFIGAFSQLGRRRARTVRAHFSLIRRLLNAARLAGLVAISLSRKDVLLPKGREVDVELRAQSFSVAEMRRFVEAAPSQFDRTVYLLLSSTGMRCGECFALEWTHLMFGEQPGQGVIDIRQTAARGTVGRTKTDTSKRKIEMGEQLEAALRSWHAAATQGQRFLFPGRRGDRPMTTANFRLHHFVPLAEQLGLNDHRSLHGFRHGFCFSLVDSGANILIVRDLMGHSNLKQTEQYLPRSAHPDRRAAIKAAELLKLPGDPS